MKCLTVIKIYVINIYFALCWYVRKRPSFTLMNKLSALLLCILKKVRRPLCHKHCGRVLQILNWVWYIPDYIEHHVELILWLAYVKSYLYKICFIYCIYYVISCQIWIYLWVTSFTFIQSHGLWYFLITLPLFIHGH